MYFDAMVWRSELPTCLHVEGQAAFFEIMLRGVALGCIIFFIIVHNITDKLLQWLEPHSENTSQLAKPVDVARVVDMILLA